jgi:small subunit ribosomal protein S16
MRMGAKKRPSYRIVVKEKLSKRDGAYLESIGTYNPLGKGEQIKLDDARAQYWIERGAQPTATVHRLIKANAKAQAAQAAQTETV